MDFITDAERQMHQRTCGWQPVIQPGSHIDKAVKKEKWKAMQEREERIAIGEDIMQKVVEAKYLGQIMSADGTTISDVRTRLAIATTKFTKLKWMWANEKISMQQKLKLYTAFVQIATYGAEAWIMDKETIGLLKEWNAHNLARMRMTTQQRKSLSVEEYEAEWLKQFKIQMSTPQYNLTGMLMARRLEWVGRILSGSEDSLPRIEILRLALAASYGIMTVEGTVLHHAPDFKSPQHLLKVAGRPRLNETLREVTPASRADAEEYQSQWNQRVIQLGGIDYDPEKHEPRENVMWEPPSVEEEAAAKTANEEKEEVRKKKEKANIERIMRKYKEKLQQLPDRTIVMYTDGGYEIVKERDSSHPVCGWGVSIRLRMRRYPEEKERNRHGWKTADIQADLAGGYQIEIKQLYGTVALDRSHTAAFMGATKWSNNTAELTAIGQALLTAAATGLQEVAIFYDSTYAQNAAAKIHAPVRRDTPNTALLATVRRIRMNNEAAGMRIQWCHVKGHSEEKGGPRSHGNEAADNLANKGKTCKENEGTWMHVTASTDFEGDVQWTENRAVKRRLLLA
jgi:ribonuclease HI